MDDYLLDRRTLGRFVDELIKQKPIAVNSAEELNVFREKCMKELDDQISDAIFDNLTDEQNKELNDILDREDDTTEEYQDFFKRAGINLEKTIATAMQNYGAAFLGGQNE